MVKDSSGVGPIENAVVMVIRIHDSLLVKFTRTDADGMFKIDGLPLDTYNVVITHPKFNDQNFIILSSAENYTFWFGSFSLPPKSHTLNEVVVYAFKDPVYYKGDTLIYTADSFKTRPNATVEDLLKKLPGIQVDAQGKITAQGKSVDKVLVDGDEFFGTDPTIATRNLNAHTIESVQVYDKKNENSTGDQGDQETIKVMDLKLKDDAKKGYFGKLSAAGDFHRFYEGEALANVFNAKRKVSVFGLGSNTPRGGFGWEDMFKYGLDNEMNRSEDDDGNMFFYSDNQGSQGIPRTLNAGTYYSEKFNSKTKLNANYSYKESEMVKRGSSISQFFLNDSTYFTSDSSYSKQRNFKHNVNLQFHTDLDSLTEIDFIPSVNFGNGWNNSKRSNDFFTSEKKQSRRSTIYNLDQSNSLSLSSQIKFRREFKNRDRQLRANYNFSFNQNSGRGNLISHDVFIIDTLQPDKNTDQQKESISLSNSHFGSLQFTEPLNKRFKLEFSADANFSKSNQNKTALNSVNGEYTLFDSVFSNNFRNERNNYRVGARLIYEIKKLRWFAGSRLRRIELNSQELLKSRYFSQSVNNVLPYAGVSFRMKNNKYLDFNYRTNSSAPTVDQLQPIPNNSNPNFIVQGNPDLKPNYSHVLEARFNMFKPVSGFGLWCGASTELTDNGFASATQIDNYGRTYSKTVNVDGNLSSSGWLGASIPLFQRKFTINPSMNYFYSKYTGFINDQKNITTQSGVNSNLSLTFQTEKLEISISGDYGYNRPYSTLNAQSNKPYSTQNYQASISWNLPKKFVAESSVSYNINSRRAAGYNVNYILWDAEFGKTFLKKENLIITLDATDILGQNISATRTVNANEIRDTKTNVITRYILLKLVYKFNSASVNDSEEEF